MGDGDGDGNLGWLLIRLNTQYEFKKSLTEYHELEKVIHLILALLSVTSNHVGILRPGIKELTNSRLRRSTFEHLLYLYRPHSANPRSLAFRAKCTLSKLMVVVVVVVV